MFEKQSIKIKDAPKAGGAAKGAGIARVEANAMGRAYAVPPRRSKRRVVHAICPAGQMAMYGQDARASEALVARGAACVTSLEVAIWAYRLGAYIFDLHHDYGLSIETVREEQDGVWHARYALHTPVIIAAVGA